MARALALAAMSATALLVLGCGDQDRAVEPTKYAGGSHAQAPIESRPGGTDPATGITWRVFTAQGVTVSIPTNDQQSDSKTWQSNLVSDICDPLYAQFFVVEHIPTRVRFRVDLREKDIRFRGEPSPFVREVAEAVQKSFSGIFEGDPRLGGEARATPVRVCDPPPDDIPPVYRAWEPPRDPSEGLEATPLPTSTSITPPTPVFRD